MRSDLDPNLKMNIQKAFLELKDSEIMKGFKGATGFGAMTDKDYDVIRDLSKLLNLDLSKM